MRHYLSENRKIILKFTLMIAMLVLILFLFNKSIGFQYEF